MAGLSLKTNLREPFVHIFVFLCSLPFSALCLSLFFAFLCLSLPFSAFHSVFGASALSFCVHFLFVTVF